MTTQAIALMQHFYTPNILILISRILAQIQITGAAYIHPQRSLFALGLMLTVLNVVAAFLHLLDFAGGMNGGKGLVLDFIGQANPASFTRVILLDLLLYILQFTALIISHVNNHSKDLPTSSIFPFQDLLLPPPDISTGSSSGLNIDESDLERGERKPRRRRGIDQAYGAMEKDESDVWLNDEDESSSTAKRGSSSQHPLLSSSPSSSRRLHEPPRIFDLTLPYVLQLILHLPAPTAPLPPFTGGTPTASPLPTPAEEVPQSSSLLSSIPEISETEEVDVSEEEDEVLDGVGRGSRSSRRRGRVRGAAWLMPDVGRIPGEYRDGGGFQGG